VADPFPAAPQSFGTLSPYTPSMRDRLIGAMQNLVGGSAAQRGTASDFAENAGNVLGMIPGVSNVLGADDAVRQYQGGHPIQAALTGAMALPIPGASAAEDAVEGPAQKLAKAITAYHGSPHSFDQFDMSKIGTGEGAQAYGHGLYFADNEEVAKQYRDELSSPGIIVAGKPFNSMPEASDAATALVTHPDAKNILQWSLDRGYPPEEAVKSLKNSPAAQKEVQGLIDSGALSTQERPGHMYQVGINADPDHFLDWDKPIGEQPKAVQDWLFPPSGGGFGRNSGVDTKVPVGTFYDRGKVSALGPRGAAQDALAVGIPGIKYLDQGSRATGDGSHNYVVFNQDLVNILKKYGLAGLGGAAGAGALMNQSQPAQAGQFPQAPPPN
jgi:hypothetical protein